jgi:hypothetical protein
MEAVYPSETSGCLRTNPEDTIFIVSRDSHKSKQFNIAYAIFIK